MQRAIPRGRGAANVLALRSVSRALWIAGIIACTVPAIWLSAAGGEKTPDSSSTVNAINTIDGPAFELRNDGEGRFHYESTFRGITIGLTDRDLYAVVGDGDGSAARTVRMSFPTALRNKRFRSLAGENARLAVVNHYVGNDPQRWILQSRRYEAVRATEVLPGVDLRLYPTAAGFEYDLVIAAGSAPPSIRLQFDGVDRIVLTESGAAQLHVGAHVVEHWAPVVYAIVDGRQQPVAAHLRTVGADAIDIMLDVPTDYSEMVVDPTIAYAGFIGGSADNEARAVSTDAAGNIYIASSLQAGNGKEEAILTKLDPDGNLLYSTRLGGSGNDTGTGVAAAPDGSVYFTGITCSANFPVINAAQPQYTGGCDAFLARVDGASGAVMFSTYLGGSGAESSELYGAPKVAADSASNAHVSGTTSSLNLPVLGAGSSGPHGNADGFYTRFSPSGAVLYSTYLGGSQEDIAAGIAIDSNGNAVVVGSTRSPKFPRVGNNQPPTGSPAPGFIAAFRPGGGIAYSMTLGGSVYDMFSAVAADDYGSLYVTGFTLSGDFPANGNQPQPAVPNAIFVRFDTTPETAQSPATIQSGPAALLAGLGSDYGNAIATDRKTGDSYVMGATTSTDFPLLSAPFNGPAQGWDVFIARMSEHGVPQYSMLLGGAQTDFGTGISLRADHSIVITGNSSSPTLPGGPSGSVMSNNGFFGGRIMVAKINAAPATCTLDIDGNGSVDALSDGLLLLRYLFGIRGPSLIAGALGPGATRTTPEEIAAFIGAHVYDVDGNGLQDALTDGLIALRHQFGLTGTSVVSGTIGAGARRTTYFQTVNWLSGCR